MHPEVVEATAAECPFCGMALQPIEPALSEQMENPELADFSQRFKVGILLGVPLLVLAMTPHLGVPLHQWVSEAASHWLQFVLATPIVLWCGWPFLKRGWTSLCNRALNMFTLIALGTATAYLFSVVVTVLPEWFEGFVSASALGVGVYFEVSSTIVVRSCSDKFSS